MNTLTANHEGLGVFLGADIKLNHKEDALSTVKVLGDFSNSSELTLKDLTYVEVNSLLECLSKASRALAAPLDIITSVTPAIYSDSSEGKIHLSISGATPPYMVSSNDITDLITGTRTYKELLIEGLSAGMYTLVVSDFFDVFLVIKIQVTTKF